MWSGFKIWLSKDLLKKEEKKRQKYDADASGAYDTSWMDDENETFANQKKFHNLYGSGNAPETVKDDDDAGNAYGGAYDWHIADTLSSHATAVHLSSNC